MAKLKEHLVDLYRVISAPYRAVRMAWDRQHKCVPISILYYHRVDDDSPNAWSISNKKFEQQIDWLEKNFDLISMKEAHRRIESGDNDRPSVCITFDDGYSDNCVSALPMLIHRRIPVTYFVSWTHVVDQTSFGHDVEAGQQLQPNTVESIRALAQAGVEIGCHTFTHMDLGSVDDVEVLRDQLVVCKREIEIAIDRPVDFFAFPYGHPDNLSSLAFQVGKEAGFLAMCSAYGGYNEVGGDAFHLQRLHGDQRISYLKNWMTIDPRIRRRKRYEYRLTIPIPERQKQKLPQAGVYIDNPNEAQHDASI